MEAEYGGTVLLLRFEEGTHLLTAAPSIRIIGDSPHSMEREREKRGGRGREGERRRFWLLRQTEPF